MVLAGDPLELRFKMTVGTAQVGGTYPAPRPVAGRGSVRAQPQCFRAAV